MHTQPESANQQYKRNVCCRPARQGIVAHEHGAAGAVNIDSNIKNDKQAQSTMHPHSGAYKYHSSIVSNHSARVKTWHSL